MLLIRQLLSLKFFGEVCLGGLAFLYGGGHSL